MLEGSKLPPELILIILEYWSPYKERYGLVIYEVKHFLVYRHRYKKMYREYISYLLKPYDIPYLYVRSR
jgi:hypothetical protein